MMKAILLMLSLWTAVVCAKPFIPQNDAQVLERLPRPSAERQLRARTAARDTTNLAQSLDLAWAWLRLGREQADPRYYGYAEAILSPWLQTPERWPEVLLLRATLRQNRHDFRNALDDLSKVLRQQPRNAQAWLTRSVILAVLGEVQAALASCQPLRRLSSSLLAATCLGNALSLTRKDKQAYELIAQALVSGRDSPIAEQLWALTVLAEIAVRQGRIRLAEQHFQRALALPQRDVYLLAAYADFLLNQGHFQQVQTLLQAETKADALLLRLALAEQHLNPSRGALLADAFEVRLNTLHRRGETSHLGDSARFWLELRQRADKGLALAQAYWVQQRDPESARLLLSAALAANSPSAAKTVQGWLQGTGLQDKRLQILLDQLAEISA